MTTTSTDIQNLQKYLICHAEAEYPEQRLMLAILLGAVYDLMFYPYEKASAGVKYSVAIRRKAAAKWFLEGKHAFFCDYVDLNPVFVIETLRKHAGLNESMLPGKGRV